MTIISAEKWEAVKIITIELKDAVENLQSTPTSLPTSEPTDSQISITLAEADLPVVKLNDSPNIPTITYLAYVYAGGQNTDSASQTVYWRMLKNGSSLSTGSFSVDANYYWTISAFYYDVSAGDTIELRLWASSTNVNWDYDAYACPYSRPFPYTSGTIVNLWVKTSEVISYPSLSLGNPYSDFKGYYVVNPLPGGYDERRFWTEDPIEHFERWKDRVLRLHTGDFYNSNKVLYYVNSSYRPYYRGTYLPTKILIRELK